MTYSEISHKEKSLFFESSGNLLFGKLYSPNSNNISKLGVVICDSLFEENLWCERVCSNLGRYLSQNGIETFSFDYFGYGNSVGNSSDVDIMSLIQNIHDACEFIKAEGAEIIALVGIRWGGTLACLASAQRDDIKMLFLVEPVEDFVKEIMKSLRANVANQFAIFKSIAASRDIIIEELEKEGNCVRLGYKLNNIDGYIISEQFYKQAEDIKLPVVPSDKTCEINIFRISEKESVEEQDNEDPLVDIFMARGVNCNSDTIYGDRIFWAYNRIFTSTAPNLYNAINNILRKSFPENKRKLIDEPRTDYLTQHSYYRWSEMAVNFTSGEGDRLEGILYQPPEDKIRNCGVVLSHGGLIGMNGAFRMNTRVARRLAESGYPCLCFDPHGFGRSQGVLENMDRRILFQKIQRGIFSRDVKLAGNFFREKIGNIKVVLFGVCGGGITNFLAQGRYPDIDASCSLSIPVMMTGVEDSKAIRISSGFAHFYLGLYRKKLFKPKYWWRLFAFKSDMKMILRILRVIFLNPFRRLFHLNNNSKKDNKSEMKMGNKRPRSNSSTARVNDMFNRHFLESYQSIVKRGCKILFVFGENDNFKWEFNTEFIDKYPDVFKSGANFVSIKEIKHANHMYTLREWQDAVAEYFISWLDRELN